jgi:hypothetical protein
MAGAGDRVTARRGVLVHRIAVAALLWTALVFAAFLLTAVIRPGNFTGDYNASAYWVTYESGFVRRGLPGSVLAALLGHPPGLLAATVTGFVLVGAGAAALVWLTRMVIREIAPAADRLAVGAIVVASPFTFALAVQNRGRYDALVVVAIVLVAALCRPGAHRAERTVTIALVVAAAVAAEEFALAFLAPPVLVGIARLDGPVRRRAGEAALALVPGVMVAFASVVTPPSAEHLAAFSRRAAQAGLAVDPAHEDSISSLGQTWRDGLAFTAAMSPVTIAICAVVLGGTAVLAWQALCPAFGRVDRRWATASMTVLAGGALILSAVGPDYRRWWGLAFVAMVACLVIIAADGGGRVSPGGVHRRATAGVLTAAVLVLSAGVQLFPVWPTWDPGANTRFSLDHLAGRDR